MTAPVEPVALDAIRIVLVEPSHPGNVGAAARAMKVMGLAHLHLVAPRFPDVLEQPEAIALASGAVDLLGAARVHATLDEALAGTIDAIALSARTREFAPPALGLRDAARRAVDSSAGGAVAFVFGNERAGLSNDDLLRCQSCCRIETTRSYGSLNLAQAVQLVAHECRLASLEGAPASTTLSTLASHAEREALLAHLEEALLAIDYLDPAAPGKLMERLRLLFARARLEREEVQWLRGMAKAMLRSKGEPLP